MRKEIRNRYDIFRHGYCRGLRVSHPITHHCPHVTVDLIYQAVVTRELWWEINDDGKRRKTFIVQSEAQLASTKVGLHGATVARSPPVFNYLEPRKRTVGRSNRSGVITLVLLPHDEELSFWSSSRGEKSARERTLFLVWCCCEDGDPRVFRSF